MPEADDGLDAGGLETARHFNVAANGFLVIDAGLRLDARPGDAESVVRDTDLLERFEVLVEARPAIERIALGRGFALLDENVPV